MEESTEIRIMRHMAWERAKGELESILATYIYNEHGFNGMHDSISDFVKKVEDNGFQE